MAYISRAVAFAAYLFSFCSETNYESNDIFIATSLLFRDSNYPFSNNLF